MEKGRVGDPSWGIHFHSCCEGGMRDNKNKNGVSQAEANGGCLSEGSPLSNNVLYIHFSCYATTNMVPNQTSYQLFDSSFVFTHCLWDDQGSPCFIWRMWGRRESINVGPGYTIIISEFERRCNYSKFI